jgi:sugar phosphate isomerase/epimerase
MAKPQVGCHLIVFRGREQEDLDGVLKEVQAAGYDGIEGRIFFEGDGRKMREKLGEYGLVQGSISSSYAMLPEIEKTIAYGSGVGAKFIMVSGVGNYQAEGLRAYERSAELFNDVGRKCRDAGIQFCYHNHSWEFAHYDPKSGQEVPYGTAGSVTGLERLYELTDPQLVKGCIDVYWVQHGGRNPAEFLQRYKDRIGYPHLKDMRFLGQEPRRQGLLLREEATFVELGRGEVDFPAIWRVLEPLELPWLAYEQDRSELPPGEAAAISRRYIKEALGV